LNIVISSFVGLILHHFSILKITTPVGLGLPH
jgi:hypothetical protein